MSIFQAIILGIVQGLTEFLPISSSGHLVLVPWIFRWQDPGLGFDVVLHWGTLVAVLWIFWGDYWVYVLGFFKALTKISSKSPLVLEEKMAMFLFIGSLPGALFGYLLEKQAETVFRSPIIIAGTMAVFGLVLWQVDKISKRIFEMGNLNWQKSLFIGLAQAVAIIPGVSRSGATMTAGLLTGLNRKAAAKFSFLLSGPIIFGAGLVALKDLSGINFALVAGFFASVVSGVLAIKFLLRYLETHNFNIFVWYRYALALLIIALLILR